MKILLDAGHGGADPGAVSKGADGKDYRECDISLEVVNRIKASIQDTHPDWLLELTRTTDSYMSPGSRSGIIKRVKPNAAISIHCNSSANAKATGHEVVYREEDDRVLAHAINKAMCEKLPLRDRGLKNDVEDLGRSLAILNTPGIPSVIVEMGFISNPEDREVLLDFDLLSATIVSGIERWAQS